MEIKNKIFEGERSLFSSCGLKIYDCIFQNGESPLKESKDIYLKGSNFKWKYPLWYSNDVLVEESKLDVTARSGIWYTHNITINNTLIEAPKTFRRSSFITLNNVNMPNALETMWNCKNIVLNDVSVAGDYFAFGSENIDANNLVIDGNYSFDGGKNITIRNSKLISKDAFWNCENVTVYDSVIVGEYLGWNSKNVTFINCEIESLQGLCYMDNLKMVNCKLINTTLAFEYSTVDSTNNGSVDSIKIPSCGIIKVDSVKELILEEEYIDPSKIKVIVGGGSNE